MARSVAEVGIEPTCLSARHFECRMSASFITRPFMLYRGIRTLPPLFTNGMLTFTPSAYIRPANRTSCLPLESFRIVAAITSWFCRQADCGPEENRTLHDLLAGEFRQPWNMRAQMQFSELPTRHTRVCSYISKSGLSPFMRLPTSRGLLPT